MEISNNIEFDGVGIYGEPLYEYFNALWLVDISVNR